MCGMTSLQLTKSTQDEILPLPLIKCRGCKSLVHHACVCCTLCVACSKLALFDKNNSNHNQCLSPAALPAVLNHGDRNACLPVRAGIFNAGFALAPLVAVPEIGYTAKSHNAIAAAAAPNFIDFDHLDMIVAGGGDTASRGIDSVVGTMSRTAAVFAAGSHGGMRGLQRVFDGANSLACRSNVAACRYNRGGRGVE